MSAPSPRPNAFLGIVDDLLGELGIALGALAVDIIENNRLTETRSFGQPDVPGNYSLENLCAEKAAEIGRDLTRE
ncbi:MAG TPA: hypothetical protein VNK47_04565, partial [Candidatus Dormibacteraeota bacterium]|nr:hypothetical protein [Candidatus Dormibacteraeota bacterium]